MRKVIKDFQGKAITFQATHLIELFPAPLPEELDELEIETESDLFRASHLGGYDEIFIADGETIDGECEGETYQFAIEDFLRWQLERVNEDTLCQLIDKTDASVCEILDGDAEYDKDPEYNPEDWLNYYLKDDHPGKAVAYIKRLREEVPDEFYGELIQSLRDESFGLLAASWYETEISGNLDEVRSSYAEWKVPLMIVSTGTFKPYIGADYDDNLAMDDPNFRRMYLRNYDEGEPS